MAFDIEMIKTLYSKFPSRVNAAKKLLGKPLTLTEKILYAHLDEGIPSHIYKRNE